MKRLTQGLILVALVGLLVSACTTPGDNEGSRAVGAAIGGALVSGLFAL